MISLYRQGDVGPAVVDVRDRLTALGFLAPPSTPDGEVDAVFDAGVTAAVRAFQQSRGLRPDGCVGPQTFHALEEARWGLGDRIITLSLSHPFHGDDVAELQGRLHELGFDPGRYDGVYGPVTDAAVRQFQREVGIVVDGTVGPATLRALSQLRRSVVGGSPQWMRDAERLHGAGPALAGKVVVLDPGHGGPDAGFRGFGLTEADITLDLARRLEGRLGALGSTVALTRDAANDPTSTARAQFANQMGADLLISLHCDGHVDPCAQGVACFYYAPAGSAEAVREAAAATADKAGVTAGQRLASLVQREVVARTDLVDLHCHPVPWDLLRLARGTCVRVEVGYLTNPHDAGRLADPAFRDTIAEAIVVAVQRLYLPADQDAPTGLLQIAAIEAYLPV